MIRPPRVWAKAVGLRAGAKVELVYGFGKLLLVVPRGSERELRRFLSHGDDTVAESAESPPGEVQ